MQARKKKLRDLAVTDACLSGVKDPQGELQPAAPVGGQRGGVGLAAQQEPVKAASGVDAVLKERVERQDEPDHPARTAFKQQRLPRRRERDEVEIGALSCLERKPWCSVK